jgi:tetratricopeptide (TPR) repeat protein
MRVSIVALALLIAAPAHADDPQPRPRLPDEYPADFDHANETYSRFWEEALRPHAKSYGSKVRTAEVAIANFGNAPKKLENAKQLLREAIELEPDTPAAYWWLGELYEKQEKWAECAAQRQKVFDLDPGFLPPVRQPKSWTLDLALGNCLARAGDYEDAIAHYRRILVSGETQRSYAHLQLGMVYMALGRINDAIDTFEDAMADRITNPSASRRTSFMYFAAAVAYDLDEQDGRARELLDIALQYDPGSSSLQSPENRFLLPADHLYFRALAESARRRRRAFAIAYFRRYVAVAGDSGWVRRADAHLEQLVGDSFDDDDISIRGAGITDSKKTRAAVLRKSADLHACLAETPKLMFRVTITKIATDVPKPRKSRRSRKPRTRIGAREARLLKAPKPVARPKGGVRVRQELAFDPGNTRGVLAAQACVTEAARAIKLPKVKGSLNSYATIEFLLISR